MVHSIPELKVSLEVRITMDLISVFYSSENYKIILSFFLDQRLTNETTLLLKHEKRVPVTSNFNKITFSCKGVSATETSLIIQLENSTSLSAVSVLVNAGILILV